MTAVKQLRRYLGAGFAIGRNGAEVVANRSGGLDVVTASGQIMQLNGVPVSTLAATQDKSVSERVSLTETATAGTYTGSVTVPAGALIEDIAVWSTALWTAATSATGKVGDATDDDGWFTGIDMKATDLLVGEQLNFNNLGGKQGAYLNTSAGLRSAAYSASARVVSFIVVTVGTTGTAGRSFMQVRYSNPTAVAGTKA